MVFYSFNNLWHAPLPDLAVLGKQCQSKTGIAVHWAKKQVRDLVMGTHAHTHTHFFLNEKLNTGTTLILKVINLFNKQDPSHSITKMGMTLVSMAQVLEVQIMQPCTDWKFNHSMELDQDYKLYNL